MRLILRWIPIWTSDFKNPFITYIYSTVPQTLSPSLFMCAIAPNLPGFELSQLSSCRVPIIHVAAISPLIAGFYVQSACLFPYSRAL